MTVLPVSMYQSVQAVQPSTTTIPVNFHLTQQMTSQPLEIAMAPASTGEVSIVMNSDLQGTMKGDSGGSQGDGDNGARMVQENISSEEDDIQILA